MTSTARRLTAWTPLIGLSVALVVVGASIWVPGWVDWDVATRRDDEVQFPPLHGFSWHRWGGLASIGAIAIAVLAWGYSARLAERLPWRLLLAAAYVAGLAWLLALALVDGELGLTRVLGSVYEYLPTAREVDDVGALLTTYVDHIPIDSPDNWVTHVAGHPPGALLFFVVLDRIGLGGDLAAAVVVVALAASTAVATLVTLRRLGDEALARRCAPFVVFTPAAVFMAVSADAMFSAVAAWGLAALAFAATSSRRSRLIGWSLVAGLLLGYCVMLSYGLPLLGLLAVGVLIIARNWRPLPIAAVAASAVVLAFAAGGFAWWEAYPVLRERYYDGLASKRPFSYWVWGNLGALLISAGPAVGAGLASLRRSSRVGAWLVGAAALALIAADLSGMSKAEVERIWLPFVPWLTISLAFVPDRWLRPLLAAQLVTALLVQHLLHTTW